MTAEDAFRGHNLHDAYKHLETLGVDKGVSVTTLKDSEGNVLTDPETVRIHAAWKEFFEVLLDCRRHLPEGVYEDLPVCPADTDFMGGNASHSLRGVLGFASSNQLQVS